MSNELECYEKTWFFDLDDTVLFTDKGLVNKYQTYAIDHYVYGIPERFIKYEALKT